MKNKKKKVRLALIASGNGSDANAIMEAGRNGLLENAEPVLLISTKPEVGCLDKAAANGVQSVVVERKGRELTEWRTELEQVLKEIVSQLKFP